MTFVILTIIGIMPAKTLIFYGEKRNLGFRRKNVIFLVVFRS